MPRIAAIDWGAKRIGLAISDEKARVGLPLKMVDSGRDHEKSASIILAALAQYGPIETIVVGLPLQLNGKKGPMAELVQRFVEALRLQTSSTIELFDERLSSAQIERDLKDMSYSRKQRKSIIDSAVAAMLLQTYLDKKNESI